MCTRSCHAGASGATLMETMVALSILMVLSAMVLPSARDFVIQHRIRSDVNEMSAMLYLGRQQAIEVTHTTILCPTADFIHCDLDWSLPRMMFTDWDQNGERSETEDLLAATGHLSVHNRLQGPKRTISFHSTGITASPATLLFCHKDLEDRFARSLTLSLQGRVRLSGDRNNDGIHENNSGKNLSCD